MKKKILSILLCLCMVAVLLPTTALAATPVENVTFGYAYDAQRSPAFPGMNETVNMTGLNKPIIKGDMENYQRGENSGSWTLTRFGTYSYVKSNNMNTGKLNLLYLDPIVTSVASRYNIDKNTIVIHELKNGGTHIAYGVVLAYSETATENMAVFVGDLWNSSGAGYLLSTKAKTGPVTVTAKMVATDFANQTDSIILAPAKPTFPAVPEGYDTVPTLEITVQNIGTEGTEQLQVNSTDVNEEKFDLSTNTIDSIAPNGTATFTITPKTGLAEGTYTATVTVSNTNVVPQSIYVSFTVTASPSTPVVIIVPDDTADTTDPAKNPETGDNSTHLLWAVMASSALCAAALLFSSRRRGEEMQ